jgi:molybdate-binding protein/DNA-binding XRE family transcriptional regulator
MSEIEIRNHLADIRRKRGYAAAELAKKIGVSRQTVYAMEAGTYVPNTTVALRLARTLDVKVEDLFSIDEEAASARVEQAELLPGDSEAEPGQPIQLCRVDRKLVGSLPVPAPWRLPQADAVILDSGSKKSAKARVQLFQDDEEELGKRLLVAGCDPGISVLARHAQRAGVELVLSHRNSSQALSLLQDGLIHIAGSHLRDEASGESNLPAVKKLFPKGSAAVISFTVWEEGIVVAKGNPKEIRAIEDLARKDVSIVNREGGAGSRMLLDSKLREAGIEPAKVKGYGRVALGHLPAAWQVRSGIADACVATRAAARVFGLDFLPLITERYDLIVRKPHLALPSVQLLFETLSRTAFRRELEGLGGYDTSAAGQRLA